MGDITQQQPQQQQQLDNDLNNINNNNSKVAIKNEFTKLWVQNSEFTSTDDADSTVYSSSAVESYDNESSISDIANDMNNVQLSPVTDVEVKKMNVLQNFFSGDNNIQTFGNIQISDSKNVHVGNVMYVTGPVHITNTRTHNNVQTNKTPERPKRQTQSNNNIDPTIFDGDGEEEQIDDKNLFIGKLDQAIDINILKIIERRTWLAMPPIEFNLLEEPVPYVIISHTATELTTTQAETVLMVRNIQTFHVESRKWNDIAYSFLIGGDGNVYKGRGWGTVGAHTYGYNKLAVGISFIGCFMNSLPPDVSLEACKLLIQRGVSEGHIHQDYKLLAHCQCSPVESPGRMLFEEIKQWPHWFNISTDKQN